MSGAQQGVKTCEKCGAAIRREQLLDHTAARYKGKLLCPQCVQEVRARIMAARKAEESGESPQAPADLPIALVEDDEPRVVAGPSSQIHGFSGSEVIARGLGRTYKRPLLKNTHSATRCRTFHCKMTDASFANLNEQINEWVDEHEDVEIKFALSNVGVVEGKHADPHLVITVFY
ncbi:MAG: hypothetical protein ACE5I3_14395 [Phycisphaerae bacterium]